MSLVALFLALVVLGAALLGMLLLADEVTGTRWETPARWSAFVLAAVLVALAVSAADIPVER